MNPGAGRLLAGVASVIVVAAVGLGLHFAGSPAEARLYRQDELRTERLRHAVSALERQRRDRGSLPASLDSVLLPWDRDVNRHRDPVTGTPFGYRILNDSTFELCAEFARMTRAEEPRWEAEWSHPAGPHCFTRHVSTRSVPAP